MSKKSDFKAATKTALVSIGIIVLTLITTLIIGAMMVFEGVAKVEELNGRWT